MSSKDLLDDRFSSPFTIDQNHRIQGEFRDQMGRLFRYTLNVRKTGFYALTGTLSMLDPSTKKTLHIGGNKAELANKPLHIPFPKLGEAQNTLIIQVIELTAYNLATQYNDQYIVGARKSKLLSEMTLTEALAAFGDEARISYSRSKSMRDKYKRQLNHMAKNMLVSLDKVTRKAVGNSLPQNATDSTKRDYLDVLRHFVAFVEVQQHVDSDFLPTIDYCLSKIAKQSKGSKNRKAMLDASNSDVLSSAAEETLNGQINAHQYDPYYIAIALIKGGGLSTQDICALRVGDVQRGKDLEEVFLALRREFSSATQNYCFPLLAWEARLLQDYMKHLENLGVERMDGNRYLLSIDAGTTQLDPSQITALCRAELQRLTFGYADLLGSADLRKTRGTELLRATYRHRLETYCGVTVKTDEGALLFLLHHSLGNKIQADHYRSFTAESGRQCLLDYVKQDRRFIPQYPRKRRKTTRTQGGRDIHTLAKLDQENEQQATITFELGPNEVAEFFTEHGARITMEDITYFEEN
jgi:hypothetical protein